MRKTKQRTTKQKTTKRKRFAAMFMASLVCVTGIDVGVLQVSSVTEISADETVPQESQTVAEEPSTEGQFVQVQPVDPVIVDEQPSSEMISIMEPSVESSTQETTVQEETTVEQQSVEFESTLEQEIEATSVEEKISQEELVEEETFEAASEEKTSEKETSEAASQEEASEEETLEETSEEMTSKDEIALFNQNNEDDIMMFSGATLYGVRLTGSGYEPVEEPNTDTWPRTYTLENLLNGYNVISFGDAEMFMHCMGGVLVQGTYNNTGSGFSDGDNIPPSYVKGSYSGKGIYNSRNSETNNPLYLGTVNALEFIGGYPYVKINGQGGIGNHTVGVYRNDNYFDFAKAKSVVTQDAASVLLAGSHVVTPESGVITVNAGTTVTINSLQGVGQIQIVGQENSMSNTIINILQSGSVTLPQEYINGSQPSVSEQTSGTAIVWNLPNATNVSIPSWNWVGHVLAPNATVYQSSGNYNGTIIGQKVELHSEGHMYPYTGPGFVPTSNDFKVRKLLDGKTPNASQKFNFTLTRVSQPDGAEVFAPRTVQNAGSLISFGTIHYNIAGSYIYEIKETSVTNDPYICDTTVYYAYVNVVASQVNGKTILSIENIQYFEVIDGKEMVPIESDEITFYNQTVQPSTTNRRVTKRWNDEADNDGKRPASIRVQLYADGEPCGAEIELNEQNGWTYAWENLPEKNGEHVINYTVDEVTVPDGYEKTIEMIENEFIIFNAHDLEKTERSVVKVWKDSNNQDGIRPEGIIVQLYADGEPYGAEVELNETNGWSYTWTELAKYAAGNEIIYTVSEKNVPGDYTTTYDITSETTITITNSYTPGETGRTVRKVWKDSNNQDGIRPESIIVQLYADGEPYGAEVELNETNGWSYTWTGLPEKKAGDYIVYSVEEVEVPEGYTVAYDLESIEKEFMITNTHTPEQTKRSVVKVWDDSNNQDGHRPESIIVQLYADGEPYGAEVELNETNGWSYTWTELAKYAAGNEIIYTVSEKNVQEDYTTTYDTTTNETTITITNSYTPGETGRTVRKVWKDSNNQDGIRPESIRVQLYADGEPYGAEVELTEKNQWSYTWTGLPEKKAGDYIVYSVEEVEVPEGYTVAYDLESVEKEFTITNTHTPEQTERSVVKVWDDSNNQDGLRPESIIVQLYADGEPYGAEVELNETNDWSYTWTGLPEKKAGDYIVYSVEEVEVPEGYTVTYDLESVEKEFTITNTHTPEQTERSVVKVWDDSNNQDGHRPESIIVQLYADGEPYGAEVELNETNGWSYTWTELAKYAAGNEIIYTVSEKNVPEDYTTTYDTTTSETTITITNSYTPGETGRTVRKVWKDSNNQDGLRPESIIVQLYADGEPYGAEVELNETNDWSYTWTGLPEKKAGDYIVYSVEEVEVPEGYTVAYDLESIEKEFMITNTHTPEQTERSVVKVWKDNNDQDDIRPGSIKVQLYANGEPCGAEVELNAANDWTHIWKELPKYAAENEIVYTVEEVEVPNGYEISDISLSDKVFTITNKHTPEETERSVVKRWNDSSDQDGLRPDSINVQLLADGEPYGTEVELSAANDWTYTWRGLPKYAAGNEIIYTVRETNVPEDYTTTYDTKGKMTTITNTYTPGETGRTVRKVWKDSNNQDGLRPDSITVQLLANGKPCGTEVELNAKNQWSHTWTGLPEKEAGSYIVYTIEEVEVPEGYNVSYDVESAPKEIVITNTYTPEETERSVVKKWDDNNNQDGLRPESIIVQLYANGEPAGDAIELSTANHWRYIWTKLDKYEAGTEILYTVKEIEVPEDYEAAYKEEGTVTTITNSYTPKQIEKTVRKVWKDNDNQNGLRPERILVQLYANGQECGSPVELNEENNWSYTWTGLAEKDAGQTIEYTVKEIGVPTGYAVSYDDKNAQDKEDIESNNSNEMVIINTATDFKVNKISAQDGHELYNTILSIYEVMPDGEISEIKVDTWTSRVNEIHNFGLKLVQGKTYILREEKATHGYKILPGDIEFTVNEDGSIHIISGLDWVCENGEAVIEKIVNENGEIVYLIRNTRNEAEEEETEPESSTDPHESQSTTPEETTEEETTSEEETTPEESSVPEETTPEESTTPMQEEESSAPDNTTPAGSTAPTTTPDQTTTPSATTPTSPRAVILGIEDMSSVLGMAMAAFGVIMLAAVAWLYVRNRKNVN